MKRTTSNLIESFLRESQMRIRYEIYADVARKENYLLISKILKEFATQKKENAIWLYNYLRKLKRDEIFEDLVVEIKIPTTYGKTIENLEALIFEEDEIWQNQYPNFADIAKVEGYIDIANKFKEFTQLERNLSQRLKMFLNLINSNFFTEKNTITFWKCLACGFEVAMDELPNDFECPSCGHLKSYFQRKSLHLFLEEKSAIQKKVSGWVCMECGYEVAVDELPDDWKCTSCGHSKAYFKRKVLKPQQYIIKSIETEKARWVCLECGNEEEIEMPPDWKCPKCGFPNK
ncbi:MAG: rubredoxin-like domain-containing protein [Promethearchaeota archaeon]